MNINISNPGDFEIGSHVAYMVNPDVSVLIGKNKKTGLFGVQSFFCKHESVVAKWKETILHAGLSQDSLALLERIYPNKKTTVSQTLESMNLFDTSQEYDRMIWVDSFGEWSVTAYIQDINRLDKEDNKSPIVLAINSWGGSIYGFLAMADHLALIDAPVVTIALGKAMSAGAALLSCGNKGSRYIYESAEILVHESLGGIYGNMAEIENKVKSYKRLNDRYLQMVSKNCGKKLAEVKEILREKGDGANDLYLNAQEAIDFGLADKILDKETYKSLISPASGEVDPQIPQDED